MAKFLTVFNIFAGGSSFIGLIYTFYGKHSPGWMYALVSIVTFILSAYVLLVSNTILERNVRSKIRKYDLDKIADLIDQRGEFEISGFAEISIEFEIPFSANPEVEIINFKGYTESPPVVVSVSKYQARVKRNNVIVPSNIQKFKWIARGWCAPPIK